MIHTLITMPIGRFILYDETGKEKYLKRSYNPLPASWFNTSKFLTEFREMVGNDNTDLDNEKHRILTYNNILKLDRMVQTMGVLMRNQSERTMFRLAFKQKPINLSTNMPIYIQKVKALTGIEVKNMEDLKRVEKETHRRLHKYNENYKPIKTDAEPQARVMFQDMVLRVMGVMQMDYNEDLSLHTFGAIKKIADERIAAANKKPSNNE